MILSKAYQYFPSLRPVFFARAFFYFTEKLALGNDLPYTLLTDLGNTNNRAQKMVITWNTKKIKNGFEFKVIKVGYNVPVETLKTGVYPTRARAVTQAKKWVRYLKAQQKAAA